jgi:hypothetical protein
MVPNVPSASFIPSRARSQGTLPQAPEPTPTRGREVLALHRGRAPEAHGAHEPPIGPRPQLALLSRSISRRTFSTRARTKWITCREGYTSTVRPT